MSAVVRDDMKSDTAEQQPSQTEPESQRDRETERDTERHRETQRDRDRRGQRDRETDRQRDRQTERERGWWGGWLKSRQRPLEKYDYCGLRIKVPAPGRS